MALFDRLRRIAGIATEQDIAQMLASRDAMHRSSDPCDRFGAAFGDFVHHLDAREARAQSKIIRDSNVAWPAAPQLRWEAAARIGREYGKELVTKRLAEVNEAELARAVNAQALGEAVAEMRTRTFNPKATTSIEDVVKDKAREITHHVHAFLSHGRIAEFNARALTNALLDLPNLAIEARLAEDVAEFLPGPKSRDRGAWLKDAHRTRLAMAQTGLLSAQATVRAAREANTMTRLRIGAIAGFDRAEAEASGPEERRALLEAAKRRIFVLAYGSLEAQPDASIKDTLLRDNPRTGKDSAPANLEMHEAAPGLEVS